MCKILIADDSALFRHSLRSCLEQNPKVSVCGEAEDGRAAIDKVKELNPDVVILDWQMPVMDGLEAARHITRIAPEATVALLTLHSGSSDRQKSPGDRHSICLPKADRLEHLSDWLWTCVSGQ
jgi:DNA-binding NarL/FixJ family response regulator